MRTRAARLAIGAGLFGIVMVGTAAALASAGRGPAPATDVEIVIHYSKFQPSEIVVPVGVPVRITLRNDDPIDHEWIVGDAGTHARHRDGTEPVHDSRPTEVSVPALEERATTVTFAKPGEYRFVCHLPGHEAYGMVGVVRVVG